MRALALVVAATACGGGSSDPAKQTPEVDDPANPLVDANLQPPDREVSRTAGIKIQVPPVPAFQPPAPSPDGSHAARELRVRGKQWLDSELTVKGVVTWVYDCLAATRQPGESDRDAQRRIDEDPTVCERPKFYIGDAADTPIEKSVWVVEVPRPYNKLEVQRIQKPDRNDPLKCEPGERGKPGSVCPPLAVGDQVELAGTWTTASPRGEHNSDGLLVYRRMKNLTQPWESPGAATPVPAPAPARQPRTVVGPAATAKVDTPRVRRSIRDDSLRAQNEGAKAFGLKQFDTAIERYTRAIEKWPANHAAMYGLAAAHARRQRWQEATAAARHAVERAPDIAMYHLSYGRYLYERAIAEEREQQAKRANRPVAEVDVDLGRVDFEPARAQLLAAAQLDPDLWRPHYLLGAIERAGDRPQQAAAAFTKAVVLGAPEPGPWIALAELYRAWDFTDHAIQIAQQAATVIPGEHEKSDVWFVVGLGYDDKRLAAKAIEAYGKALEARRDNHKAKFARGQAYFRLGDFTNAKRDLEEFYRAAGSSLEHYKQQAARMLMDIAAR